jgi:hypothetical protein
MVDPDDKGFIISSSVVATLPLEPPRKLTCTIDPEEAKSILAAEFARDPCFLDEVNELIVKGCFNEESLLFDYLFVAATRIAPGTNDKIVGFRLRDAQERALARLALNDEPSIGTGHQATET